MTKFAFCGTRTRRGGRGERVEAALSPWLEVEEAGENITFEQLRDYCFTFIGI